MKRILLIGVCVSFLFSCERLFDSAPTINNHITTDYLLNGNLNVYLQNNQVFRYTGKPGTVTIPIGNADLFKFESCFVLHVETGTTKATAVSSAIIKLDGIIVLSSSDFSKNVGRQYTFEICKLMPTSVLTVQIDGKPGSYLNIWIEGKLKGLIDIDGNLYKIVKIGNQVWMAENLKTTRYNDGNIITNVTEDYDWQYNYVGKGAYCWQNNQESYKDIYGALYNWYAVETGNLCPTGWHVPTDDDWKQLEIYLGMSQEQADEIWLRGTEEGGKLKEIGTEHWNDPNVGATNETGFSALGGGYRQSGGTFVDLKLTGHWWSSTVFDPSNAWYRYIRADNSTIGRLGNTNLLGFSVRCIKN